jgi:hypothetical protein
VADHLSRMNHGDDGKEQKEQEADKVEGWAIQQVQAHHPSE